MATIAICHRALPLLVLLCIANGEVSLSRRKRYLIFPEGSSLQVVFELLLPIIMDHPQPFTVSWTLAAAYQLPTEPKHILEAKYGITTQAPTTTSSTKAPEHHFIGWNDFGMTHHNSWQPLEVKDSEQMKDEGMGNKMYQLPQWKKYTYNHKQYFYKNYPGYFKPKEVILHRRHRRDAYLKMESTLLAMGLGGRSCVLKTLCEAGQRRADSDRGSFMAELLHVLFTLPPEPGLERTNSKTDSHSDVLDHYDEAHAANGDCDILYPECDRSLFELLTPNDIL